jgi:hypothetical protein
LFPPKGRGSSGDFYDDDDDDDDDDVVVVDDVVDDDDVDDRYLLFLPALCCFCFSLQIFIPFDSILLKYY